MPGAPGAWYRSRAAQTHLAKCTVQRRRVHHHHPMSQSTARVGGALAEEHLKPPTQKKCAPPAPALIVHVDGGPMATKEPPTRSVEALAAGSYRSESRRTMAQQPGEMEPKSCALSAQDDALAPIQTSGLTAARRQGVAQAMEGTARADGAHNGWAGIVSRDRPGNQITGIVDWGHSGKKFQHGRSAVEDGDKAPVERVK